MPAVADRTGAVGVVRKPLLQKKKMASRRHRHLFIVVAVHCHLHHGGIASVFQQSQHSPCSYTSVSSRSVRVAMSAAGCRYFPDSSRAWVRAAGCRLFHDFLYWNVMRLWPSADGFRGTWGGCGRVLCQACGDLDRRSLAPRAGIRSPPNLLSVASRSFIGLDHVHGWFHHHAHRHHDRYHS